jgi:hypothetical protein
MTAVTILIASALFVCLLPFAVLARRIRWHRVGQGWDEYDWLLARWFRDFVVVALWLAMLANMEGR